MTVFVIQPGSKSCIILIAMRTNTHADTCATEQRIPPCIIVAIMLDEKELVVLYPHALRGPASAGVLNRRGECCYGDRFL